MKPSELIRRYGWVQGWIGNKDCGYCLVNALVQCGIGAIDFQDRVNEKICGMSIVAWQDDPCRTVEEVIALLEGEGL